MNQDPISFQSSGLNIRGYWCRPDERGAAPLIIIAPGFGSTIEHTALKFAQALCVNGYNTLVYDQPNFGHSDSLVPQEVDPLLQLRAYRDAITFGETLDKVDPSRIALWGSSFCGGHAINTAAFDRRIKCVVSQVPSIDGYQHTLRRTRPSDQAAQLQRFYDDRLARFKGAEPKTVKLVSADMAEPVVFPGRDAYDYYAAPAQFVNYVTLRSLELSREYRPGLNIGLIAPTPFMMIVASQDTVTPSDIALQAYQSACEPKRLVIVEGGHFSPYIAHFDRVIAESTEWFRAHLK
jgi:pimeloyl-ACP methyl ester carboxylesterase